MCANEQTDRHVFEMKGCGECFARGASEETCEVCILARKLGFDFICIKAHILTS